jgi:glycosyltransferase involved in cell wall biosynthesis
MTPDPLSVCFVTGEFPPMQGGVGDYTRALAQALARLGQRVAVVTSVKGDWSEPGISTYPVVKTWDYSSWGHVQRVLHAVNADVLHIQYQTAAFAMHPAINLLPLRLRATSPRPRTVFTYHDLRVPYLFPKAGPLRRWMTEGPARWCDAAIVTNVEDCIQLGRSRLPFHVIPIGSNISTALPPGYDRAAWRAKLGVAPQETLLCYFGFLNESKGGETLIRMMWDLVSQNRAVKLVMVGGLVGDSDPTNVAYLARITKLIEELKLTEHVLWTGFTSDEEVRANLVASDAAVLLYRDGASFRRGSFMAALSHGLPIITTKGPGTATPPPGIAVEADLPCLTDSDNVLLATPDDAGSAARAVIRLMANPALRQRLAVRARVLAQEFGWDSIARRTLDVYRGLLAQNRS